MYVVQNLKRNPPFLSLSVNFVAEKSGGGCHAE
jgi:hypothetical protein